MIRAFFKKRSTLVALLISFVAFVIFYILNEKTPIWSDDWAFYVGYQSQRVRSMTEVFSSISYFYSHVNGRSVANFIIVSFAFLGKNIFNFFNALMFVLLGLAIYHFSGDGKKVKPLGILAIFMLLWFFLPAPNQTLFWMCGSVVYLWMAVLTLLFLIPFRGLFLQNRNFMQDSRSSVFWMFIFGILVGNSHELLAPVVFLVILFSGYVLFKEKKKVPKWAVGGFFGVAIGTIVQFLAPGNYQKLGHTLGSKSFFNVISNLDGVIQRAISHQEILWGMVGLIIVLYAANKFYLRKDRIIIDRFMILLILMAVALDALGIFFPYFPPRALFFSSVALIMIISRFVMMEEFKMLKYLLVLVFVPTLILSVRTTLVEASKLSALYDKREASITEQKKQGRRDIVVEKIGKIENRKLLGETLSRNNHLGASLFYGVDSIRLK